MKNDLKGFRRRFQSGVDVSVASTGRMPDKLRGIRDGFQRYFEGALGKRVPITVSPAANEDLAVLLMSDRETLETTRARTLDLRRAVGDDVDFVLGSETGLAGVETGGEHRYMVRTWVVISGFGKDAWGTGGSLQLPPGILDEDAQRLVSGVPGTRRRGGMVGTLTSGLESRRQSTELATVNALSSLLYDLLEPAGVRLRGR
ncbi:MAG: DUF84 family protein [Acidobacteriota bacterium]